MKILRSMYDWMGKQVHSPHATSFLALLFFVESSVLFIPVDPFLMLYCVEHRNRSLYFASIATIASVVGGLFGYYIGYGLWEIVGKAIVNAIINPTTFARAVDSFNYYESLAVLIAGFTPVPYKAVTIGAGFCKLPLAPFIGYSLIARGARFFLLAGVIKIWGAQIKEYIDRYFNLLVLLFVGIALGGFWLIKITAG